MARSISISAPARRCPRPHRRPASADLAARGGYVLAEAEDRLDVIIIATGSEVAIALDARALLGGAGIGARVVSMPCVEWFRAQDQAYRDSVIDPGVRARVSGCDVSSWPRPAH